MGSGIGVSILVLGKVSVGIITSNFGMLSLGIVGMLIGVSPASYSISSVGFTRQLEFII